MLRKITEKCNRMYKDKKVMRIMWWGAIPIVLLCAFFDWVLIGSFNLVQYIWLCAWEYCIFWMGLWIGYGLRTSRKFVTMKYKITVEKDEAQWWVATCHNYKGCYSQGKNMSVALTRLAECIRLCEHDSE